jgi:hypothetical protein
MKLSEPIDRMKEWTSLNETVQETVDHLVGALRDVLNLENTEEGRGVTYLDGALFRGTLEDWIHRHPGQPARLLTIRPWDETDRESAPFDYAGATRREIVGVLRRQLDGTFLMTRFEPGTFAVFLTVENGTFVENDFDWMNKVEGIRTDLPASIPLAFHVESAFWPRDASTALSLIDHATPPRAQIPERSFPDTERSVVDELLNGTLPERLERNLPDSVRERLVALEEFTDSGFLRDPIGYLKRVN